MSEVPFTWYVVCTFHIDGGWIIGPARSKRRRFEVVEPSYEHDRSRPNASASNWYDYLGQAIAAWRLAARHPGGAGVITVFPQLAVLVGLIKRLTFSKRPVIAWMFNLGQTYTGVKGRLARFALRSVDKFVVHSRREVEAYSLWLGIPADRFQFVPLSIKEQEIHIEEDITDPFVLSMGTANRDYATLFDAMDGLPYRAVVVAGPHALKGLAIPTNVSVRSGVAIEECHALCQRARISVVPLLDTETAAGQVSILEAMMLGRPVIASACAGTVDYIESGVNGVLVAPGQAKELRAAIVALWSDLPTRARLSRSARATALERHTFDAAAQHLVGVLDSVAPSGVR